MLLNFSLDPTPSLEQMVDAARKSLGNKKEPISVPRTLVLAASYPIGAIARFLQIEQPINPTRIRKLFRATYVEASGLRDLNYRPIFTIESAFEDWKKDLPSDFGNA